MPTLPMSAGPTTEQLAMQILDDGGFELYAMIAGLTCVLSKRDLIELRNSLTFNRFGSTAYETDHRLWTGIGVLYELAETAIAKQAATLMILRPKGSSRYDQFVERVVRHMWQHVHRATA